MDRPLKILTFLLSVFLLSQSHSLVESLPSDRLDRVSSPPQPLDEGTPPPHHRPKRSHHGSPPPPHHRYHPPKPHKKRKMNLGKKIGVMFLGIGVALQVVVVGVLGFKRWQISKKMKERQWDSSA